MGSIMFFIVCCKMFGVTDVPTFANIASEVENSYPEVMMIE